MLVLGTLLDVGPDLSNIPNGGRVPHNWTDQLQGPRAGIVEGSECHGDYAFHIRYPLQAP